MGGGGGIAHYYVLLGKEGDCARFFGLDANIIRYEYDLDIKIIPLLLDFILPCGVSVTWPIIFLPRSTS